MYGGRACLSCPVQSFPPSALCFPVTARTAFLPIVLQQCNLGTSPRLAFLNPTPGIHISHNHNIISPHGNHIQFTFFLSISIPYLVSYLFAFSSPFFSRLFFFPGAVIHRATLADLLNTPLNYYACCWPSPQTQPCVTPPSPVNFMSFAIKRRAISYILKRTDTTQCTWLSDFSGQPLA